jgi:hypothetical protein
MTHYQKLTAILIRICCLVGFLFSFIGFGYSILFRLGEKAYSVQAAESFYASIFYFLFSLILFVLSKPLAKLLCKGIDNHDR